MSRRPGIDADGAAVTEADHHMRCPGCGRWFDMRDLGQVAEHVHDGPIEIDIGETPPGREEPFRL